jgi:hypothetical protein
MVALGCPHPVFISSFHPPDHPRDRPDVEIRVLGTWDPTLGREGLWVG